MDELSFDQIKNKVFEKQTILARIYAQMLENRFGGVCCETGIAYVPCNNHALSSNALHDALHGTAWSRANARWLRSVREKSR